MAILVAIPAFIYFFFFLELSILIKLVAIAFCIFQWVTNRNAIVNSIFETSDAPIYDGAHRNPLIQFFMIAGMIGSVIGVISVMVDAFKYINN